MERTTYASLLQWKKSSRRKPLVLKGARQTGKTYLLKEFGRREFNRLHYLNFQEKKSLCSIFQADLDPVLILEQIRFVLDTPIDSTNDLLFFDEIQDCPRALTSLKYFAEKMPELALVSAGSLLGVMHTNEPFPVGKVNFLHLRPLSFSEFLRALPDERGLDAMQFVTPTTVMPEIIHDHLLRRLREYLVVGGLPEVVKEYVQYQDDNFTAFRKVRHRQNELITAYMGDFSKYSGKLPASQIVNILEAIPSQLAKENKKYKISDVVPGGRFPKLLPSIDWLVGSGLAVKVKISNSGELPLSAFTKQNSFKLYFFDTGLLGALAKLSPNVIFSANNLFATFKGAFCENFVAQEFLYSGKQELVSWRSNTAEVEFLQETSGKVVPIEVKAGRSGKLKSLNVFAQKYGSPYRVRFSTRNLEINNAAAMHSYPLYLASRFPLEENQRNR